MEPAHLIDVAGAGAHRQDGLSPAPDAGAEVVVEAAAEGDEGADPWLLVAP